MNAVVLPDGSVNIPEEIRDALGLAPGTQLEVENQAGKLVAWKKESGNPFEKWRGRGKAPEGIRSTDQYLALVRNGHGS